MVEKRVKRRKKSVKEEEDEDYKSATSSVNVSDDQSSDKEVPKKKKKSRNRNDLRPVSIISVDQTPTMNSNTDLVKNTEEIVNKRLSTKKFWKEAIGSLAPSSLLTSMDQLEGVRERTSNRNNHTVDNHSTTMFGCESTEFSKIEDKFDHFVEHCSERSEYFAAANILFIVYAMVVLLRCTFFEGAHNYVFIGVTQVEPRLFRTIWFMRVTCLAIILTLTTIKAYFKKFETISKHKLMKRKSWSMTTMKSNEFESNENMKFCYATIEMSVFLLAISAFIYAHCTQLIVTLDNQDSYSLYGLLQQNLKVEYTNEWDAGPKPIAVMKYDKYYNRAKYGHPIVDETQNEDSTGIPHVEECHPYQKYVSSSVPRTDRASHGMSGYLDTAQMELECCGLDSFEDWVESRWYELRKGIKAKIKTNSWTVSIPAQPLKTPVVSVVKSREVPLTCCQQFRHHSNLSSPSYFWNLIRLPCEREKMFFYLNNLTDDLEYTCTPHPHGCFPKIKHIYYNYSLELMIHAAVMSLVSFVFLLLSQLFVSCSKGLFGRGKAPPAPEAKLVFSGPPVIVSQMTL